MRNKAVQKEYLMPAVKWRAYMENKVLLVLIDGLRPDALEQCSHSFLKKFMHKCSYTKRGLSVNPSVTLPCHMSIFHSVNPDRHGVMENIYVRPPHPVNGLFEVLAKNKKKSFFFYTWEELRDIGRPGSLARQEFCSYEKYGRQADVCMCLRTIEALKNEQPDFIFYYMTCPDEVGHKYGWMSTEYMDAVNFASETVKKIVEALPENYNLIITADHGGHDRTHGTTMAEDMMIPMMFYGTAWEADKEMNNIGLLDLAPTIASLLGCEPDSVWEGSNILSNNNCI